MLSNLFGKKDRTESTAIFKDKVYIHASGKIVACVQLATTNANCIFIAWFPETAATFQNFFNQYNIDAKRLILAKRWDISCCKITNPCLQNITHCLQKNWNW